MDLRADGPVSPASRRRDRGWTGAITAGFPGNLQRLVHPPISVPKRQRSSRRGGTAGSPESERDDEPRAVQSWGQHRVSMDPASRASSLISSTYMSKLWLFSSSSTLKEIASTRCGSKPSPGQ